MSQAPSMPMFWDAYLADTTHLSTEEHGAYLLLLAAMWRRNGWVPDDDKDNARILGMTAAKWRRIKERLAPFLTFKDGHISQKNLLKIWEKTQEKIEKNRENGARGGRPKSSKINDVPKANGSISQKPIETIPEPEPEPEEVTANAATSGAQPQRGSGDLLSEVMAAVGLTNGRCPSHWMPPAATIHVKRWQTDLGLTEAQIIEAARESRKRHDEPPNGPKALDSAMKRLAGALKADPLRPASSPTPQQSDTASKRDRWRKLAGDAA